MNVLKSKRWHEIMGITCMIFTVFKNILCSKIQGHLEVATWGRFKGVFLRSEIPGCLLIVFRQVLFFVSIVLFLCLKGKWRYWLFRTKFVKRFTWVVWYPCKKKKKSCRYFLSKQISSPRDYIKMCQSSAVLHFMLV